MALLSPKAAGAGRHGGLGHGHGHGHGHAAGLASGGSGYAYVFALGLLVVALVSIIGLGSMQSFERQQSCRAACGGKHVGPGTQSPFHEQRSEVYDKMEADFNEKGAEFLFGGATSQSLKVADLFRLEKGEVKPVLKPARPPVRANVLYIDPEFAAQISAVVKEHLVHHFPGGVWFQDADMYHMSLFHASHHLSPVPATAKQVEEEERAVKLVSKRLCPLTISLDRVVLTTTGVLMGCWQVLDGTDPAEFRDMLREALPRAPKQQMYNRVMLHTSFARIVAPPIWPDGTLAHNAEQAMPILRSIVSELNQKLCRWKTLVHELWYVEEMDVLALALQGKMKERRFNLTCLHPDWTATV